MRTFVIGITIELGGCILMENVYMIPHVSDYTLKGPVPFIQLRNVSGYSQTQAQCA